MYLDLESLGFRPRIDHKGITHPSVVSGISKDEPVTVGAKNNIVPVHATCPPYTSGSPRDKAQAASASQASLQDKFPEWFKARSLEVKLICRLWGRGPR